MIKQVHEYKKKLFIFIVQIEMSHLDFSERWGNKQRPKNSNNANSQFEKDIADFG